MIYKYAWRPIFLQQNSFNQNHKQLSPIHKYTTTSS